MTKEAKLLKKAKSLVEQGDLFGTVRLLRKGADAVQVEKFAVEHRKYEIAQAAYGFADYKENGEKPYTALWVPNIGLNPKWYKSVLELTDGCELLLLNGCLVKDKSQKRAFESFLEQCSFMNLPLVVATDSYSQRVLDGLMISSRSSMPLLFRKNSKVGMTTFSLLALGDWEEGLKQKAQIWLASGFPRLGTREFVDKIRPWQKLLPDIILCDNVEVPEKKWCDMQVDTVFVDPGQDPSAEQPLGCYVAVYPDGAGLTHLKNEEEAGKYFYPD